VNEIKHGHRPHGDPNGGSNHSDGSPYWKRAHCDWRIWFCVILMLAAMGVYLMTGDLRWPIYGHSEPMVRAAVGQ
jgi:hypothetical protein